jgi:hypothetical protein
MENYVIILAVGIAIGIGYLIWEEKNRYKIKGSRTKRKRITKRRGP